jgi:hypothetical protein
VANGVVTAVANGETTITVTAAIPTGSPPQTDGGSGPTATAVITVDITSAEGFFPLDVGRSWEYLIWESYGSGGPGAESGGVVANTERTATDQILGTVSLLGYLWYRACGGGLYGGSWYDPSQCDLYRVDAEGVHMFGDEGTQGPIPFLMAPIVAGATWQLAYGDGFVDNFTIMAVLASMVVEGVTYHNVAHLRVQGDYDGIPDLRMDLYFAMGVGMIMADWAWWESGDIWTVFRMASLLSTTPGGNASISAELGAAVGGPHGFDPPADAKPYRFFGIEREKRFNR